MVKLTGLKNAPVFCPIVSDFYSGMEVTVPLFKEQLLRGNIEDIKNVSGIGDSLFEKIKEYNRPKEIKNKLYNINPRNALSLNINPSSQIFQKLLWQSYSKIGFNSY